MNTIINNYYDIYVDAIKIYDKHSIILSNDEVYIIKELNSNSDFIEKYYLELKSINKKIFNIILNKNNNLITDFNNKKYVLFRISEPDKIESISFFPLNINYDKNISKIWEEKLDYYISLIKNMGLNNKVLLNTFNYYVGMAENAIALYNDVINMNGFVRNSISHNRIHYPNYSLFYNDPTNIIIDNITKDISEYIKSSFFSSKIDINEIYNMINNLKLNNKEFNLLLTRLLYPSYFFDAYENNDNDTIISITNKIEEYEKFIADIYKRYKNIYSVIEIDWIKKVEQL